MGYKTYTKSKSYLIRSQLRNQQLHAKDIQNLIEISKFLLCIIQEPGNANCTNLVYILISEYE